MSDGEELVGCIGAVLGVALLIAAAVVAIITILGVGSLYGAGVAIFNYFQAFRDNVSPREVPA